MSGEARWAEAIDWRSLDSDKCGGFKTQRFLYWVDCGEIKRKYQKGEKRPEGRVCDQWWMQGAKIQAGYAIEGNNGQFVVAGPLLWETGPVTSPGGVHCVVKRGGIRSVVNNLTYSSDREDMNSDKYNQFNMKNTQKSYTGIFKYCVQIQFIWRTINESSNNGVDHYSHAFFCSDKIIVTCHRWCCSDTDVYDWCTILCS